MPTPTQADSVQPAHPVAFDRSRTLGLASVVVGAALLVLGTVFVGLVPLLVQRDGFALYRSLAVAMQVLHGVGGLVGLALGSIAVVRGGRGAVLGGVGIGLAIGALAAVLATLLQLGVAATAS